MFLCSHGLTWHLFKAQNAPISKQEIIWNSHYSERNFCTFYAPYFKASVYTGLLHYFSESFIFICFLLLTEDWKSLQAMVFVQWRKTGCGDIVLPSSLPSIPKLKTFRKGKIFIFMKQWGKALLVKIKHQETASELLISLDSWMPLDLGIFTKIFRKK